MQEKIQEIAARLKELRELSGLSAERVAERLEIAAERYAGYESGKEDIPASILVELAHILQVETTVLLTGEDPHMKVFTVTRALKGVSVERHKDYRYQSLAANFIHRKAEPFIVTVEPKPEGTPLSVNSHPGQELDYLLEGRLLVNIHGNQLVLEPGDCIFFDSGYGHGMAALGGLPAKFLAIIL